MTATQYSLLLASLFALGAVLQIVQCFLASDFNVRYEANSDAGTPFMASQGYLS